MRDDANWLEWKFNRKDFGVRHRLTSLSLLTESKKRRLRGATFTEQAFSREAIEA
jgi:hypothetical protein